jgi:DNA polymerase Ligase (LigD)
MKRSPSSDSVEPEPEDQIQPTPPVLALASLSAPVSPPQKRATLNKSTLNKSTTERTRTSTPGRDPNIAPSLAAIEAGQVEVTDHLGIFSAKFGEFARPTSDIPPTPRISIPGWEDLYKRNSHAEGRHFVVHQHDHPVSGVHYDLRLQFSDTSTVSWSVMYGLPGDPNSVKLNRNATETRVHCLWVSLSWGSARIA